MKILLIEPRQSPRPLEIEGTLPQMQQLVGGTIQAAYPFSDYVALVCNDEGKLLGLPLNRGLFHPETGELYDIVAGAFFLCGAPPDQNNFTSLTDSQIEKYMQYFRLPETFLQINGQIVVVSETIEKESN